MKSSQKGLSRWEGWSRVTHREAHEAGLFKSRLIGFRFQKKVVELELPPILVCKPVHNRVPLLGRIGARFLKPVFGKRRGSPSRVPNIVVEAGKLSPRPQDIGGDLTKAEELFSGLGIIQQIHGHDNIDSLGHAQCRYILMHIFAAQRLAPFLFFGQPDHFSGNVYPGDLRGPGPLDFSGVEPLATGQVHYVFAPNISQYLKQSVLFHILPKGQPLGVLIGRSNGVVFLLGLGHGQRLLVWKRSGLGWSPVKAQHLLTPPANAEQPVLGKRTRHQLDTEGEACGAQPRGQVQAGQAAEAGRAVEGRITG